MGKDRPAISTSSLARLNLDSRAILDEEMARLRRQLGAIPQPTPAVAEIAAAVKSGRLGPNPQVVEMVANWRRGKMTVQSAPEDNPHP